MGAELLGAHVCGSAEQVAAQRERGRSLDVVAGEPEVEITGSPPAVTMTFAGLNVAMDDARPRARRERAGDLLEERARRREPCRRDGERVDAGGGDLSGEAFEAAARSRPVVVRARAAPIDERESRAPPRSAGISSSRGRNRRRTRRRCRMISLDASSASGGIAEASRRTWRRRAGP